MGSIGFLVDFEFYMAVLGVGRGPIGLVAPLRFKTLDSQPEKSNMGPVSTDVHYFCYFLGKWRRLSGPVFTVFSAWSSQKTISECFGRNQKDARRKVMQIRGGITSRSAVFDLFVSI